MLFFQFNLSVSGVVLVILRYGLQVHVALAVEHHFRDLEIQIVLRTLEALQKLISYEPAVVGPSLEGLGNQVVSESFELLVAVLHLVVLGVENH